MTNLEKSIIRVENSGTERERESHMLHCYYNMAYIYLHIFVTYLMHETRGILVAMRVLLFFWRGEEGWDLTTRGILDKWKYLMRWLSKRYRLNVINFLVKIIRNNNCNNDV